jgi:hypothetical protein
MCVLVVEADLEAGLSRSVYGEGEPVRETFLVHS